MGQGIWTPWQMLAWGACGAAGGLVPRLVGNRLGFAALSFVLGFAFSALMDVWEWYSFFPHTWEAFAVLMSRGVPFDLAHAIGNVVLVAVAGPELRRVLDRYGRRLHTEIQWA
jgi:energy-coupling factor transport system substrate-specific component